jgi:hypothetical protein
MGRRAWLLIGLLGLAGCSKGASGEGGASDKRPSNQDELVALVPGAMQSGNVERLLVSEKELAKYCPNESADEIAKEIADRIRRSELKIADCRKLSDWSKARQLGIEVRRPDHRKPSKACPGVVGRSDIRITYAVADRKAEVKLNDPANFGDEAFVAKTVSCKVAGDTSAK